MEKNGLKRDPTALAIKQEGSNMGFKPAYKSTMSDERRKELRSEAIAAMKAGDMDLARKIAMKVPLSLPMANVLKQDWGIKRMLEVGCNLDDAVAIYGKEWLND